MQAIIFRPANCSFTDAMVAFSLDGEWAKEFLRKRKI